MSLPSRPANDMPAWACSKSVRKRISLSRSACSARYRSVMSLTRASRRCGPSATTRWMATSTCNRRPSFLTRPAWGHVGVKPERQVGGQPLTLLFRGELDQRRQSAELVLRVAGELQVCVIAGDVPAVLGDEKAFTEVADG